MAAETVVVAKPGRWRKASSEAALVPRVAVDEKPVCARVDEGERAAEESAARAPCPVIEAAANGHDIVDTQQPPDCANTASGTVLDSRWRRQGLDKESFGAGCSVASASTCIGGTIDQTLSPTSKILLRSGVGVPVLGLGTRQLKPGAECRDAVRAALRCGYCLVDTAPSYGNEEDVGLGIKAAGLRREDVFIVTKLPNADHGDLEDVRDALATSLERLGTSYVDLYLLQSPKGGNLIQTWDAMLAIKSMGLARAVGVSNFGTSHIKGIQALGRDLPDVVQSELHFGLQQRELASLCARERIVVMASSPLAHARLFGGQTALASLAAKRGRTEAELAIRWCLQRGYIVTPKSKDPKRIEANAPFGFTLSSAEMAEIDRLDRGFISSPATKCAGMPWEQLLHEVSEVSEDDVTDGKGQRRRRRRKRKGKGKGKGSGSGAKGKVGKGGGTSAARWSDMVTGLS